MVAMYSKNICMLFLFKDYGSLIKICFCQVHHEGSIVQIKIQYSFTVTQ